MVEDRITDGKRIAQLLASELTGLETAPLDRLSVVDATPEVDPTPDGSEAYGVAVDDERIGTVLVYPEYAELVVDSERPASGETALRVEVTGGRSSVRIESGAAVKRAVDLLASLVE